MFQPERVVIYDVFEISCNAVFEYVPLKMVIPARIFSVLSPGVHMEELKVSAAVVGNYLPFAVGSVAAGFFLRVKPSDQPGRSFRIVIFMYRFFIFSPVLSAAGYYAVFFTLNVFFC